MEKRGIKPDDMYQILFERSPLPMWVYLTDSFRIWDVNEAALTHYGYSKGEFFQLTIKDLRPPEHIALIESAVRNLETYTKLFSQGVYQHKKKNGDIIDVQIKSSIIFIEDQKAELVVATDITEMVAAEREKAFANKRLREAQKIAKLGYWSRKLSENVSEWSPELYKIYDQDPNEFTPTDENLLACVYAPDRLFLRENIGAKLKFNESHDFKYRIVTKGGEIRWVFQRIELQKDIDGEDIIMGITQDITEIKKVGEKFKAVFDNTNDAIIIGDDDGNCLDYNPAAVVLFGRAPQELESIKLYELLKHPDHTRFTNMWDRFLTGKERSGTADLLKKDGTVVSVNYNAKPDILPDIHVCIFTDITEQLVKQKQLLTSERRFKALVQDGADLIGILDIDGHYRFVAESSMSILGVHPKEFINRSVFEFIHPEDRSVVTELFNELLKGKQIKIPPFRFLDGRGHYRWLETICANLLGDPSVCGIVANSRDITDYKQNLATVKLQNEKLKDIAWAQSHMSRAPLARMMGIVDLLKNYENTESEKNTLFEYLMISADELDSIIREIADKTNQIE